jgi:tetratricopeptide (TPR) repeat protein
MRPAFRRRYRATPLMALLVLFALLAFTQPTTSPQNLYQIEAQAALEGWTPALHRTAAGLHLDRGDWHQAVAHWEAVEQPDVSLLEQIAAAYLALDRLGDAVSTYERLLTLDPDHAPAHYRLGLLLAGSDPRRAMAHLRVVSDDPTYAEVALALLSVYADDSDENVAMAAGVTLVNAELWPYAELAFKHAAATQYPYPVALAYVGLSREQQGKDGQPAIESALALDPQSPQVWYVRGLSARARGDYEIGRVAFVMAARLDPANPAYYAELGLTHQRLFEYETAEHWLRVAVAASESDRRFQQILAVFYAQEGYRLTAESLPVVQQSRAALPPDPDLLASYAWTLYTLGAAQAALDEVDAALALAPENPLALYNKGRILLDLDEVELAVPLLERAASAGDPYTTQVERLLEGVED